ncbi:MAG: DNA polymerase III subunit delta' [Desulfobacterales bacterium]
MPVRLLKILLAKDAWPHALLFSGIDGVGKTLTARVFAMAVNCERRRRPPSSSHGTTVGNALDSTNPCGTCRSCRRIAGGHHPDIYTIEPDGAYIRIAQVRELLNRFSLKPHGSGYRVAIIRDAHLMNLEAANALLKLLEEPPEKSLLLLIADRISDLLPTIVSRCQSIRFRPLSPSIVAEMLAVLEGADPGQAEGLAAIAGGSISKALAMRSAGWVGRRQWLIDRIDHIGEMPVGALLAFSEMLSKDRDHLAAAIDVIAGWYRDLAVVMDAPETVDNRDMIHRLSLSASRLGPERTESAIQILLQTARSLAGNINFRLAVDVMVMRLAGLYGAV